MDLLLSLYFAVAMRVSNVIINKLSQKGSSFRWKICDNYLHACTFAGWKGTLESTLRRRSAHRFARPHPLPLLSRGIYKEDTSTYSFLDPP